jgi:hypothetical protein
MGEPPEQETETLVLAALAAVVMEPHLTGLVAMAESTLAVAAVVLLLLVDQVLLYYQYLRVALEHILAHLQLQLPDQTPFLNLHLAVRIQLNGKINALLCKNSTNFRCD